MFVGRYPFLGELPGGPPWSMLAVELLGTALVALRYWLSSCVAKELEKRGRMRCLLEAEDGGVGKFLELFFEVLEWFFELL